MAVEYDQSWWKEREWKHVEREAREILEPVLDDAESLQVQRTKLDDALIRIRDAFLRILDEKGIRKSYRFLELMIENSKFGPPAKICIKEEEQDDVRNALSVRINELQADFDTSYFLDTEINEQTRLAMETPEKENTA